MDELLDDDCVAIRQAARHVTQLYDRHLSHVGLTITQFSLMGYLARIGPMTMKQLAAAMRMNRTTLVRTIQPLRRDGLVSSEALGADARERSMGLTAAGEALFQAAYAHWSAAQTEFAERFGARRAAALRGELLSIAVDSR